MYKKQLRFQKIICLLAIIVAAIWFVYSLGFITTIYELLAAFSNPKSFNYVPGAEIYWDMQPFNKAFTNYALYAILISLLLMVTNTQIRRKYYISNYIAIVANVAVNVAMPIYVYSHISKFIHQFNTAIDFEKLREMCGYKNIKYTESTWLLDINVVIGALSILVAIGLVVNLIWKISLMRGEKKLINAGKEVA